MPSIAAATDSIIRDWTTDLEAAVQGSATLADAAQTFTDKLFENLDSTAVLVRLYGTVPYGDLPDFNREFVSRLALTRGVSHELRDGTPVLSLLGTTGVEASWCERDRSQKHLGIPLTSSSFVQAIPMVARLLQQMGLGIDWLDAEALEQGGVVASPLSGSFYVKDAVNEVDGEGRKVTPARDFVNGYQVKTVFGSGGTHSNGRVIVAIIFANETISETDAAKLQSLVDGFVEHTNRLSNPESVF